MDPGTPGSGSTPAPAAAQGSATPAPAAGASDATPGPAPSVADLTAAAVDMANKLPADTTAAPAAAEKPKTPPAATVTQRISQLAAENRALKARAEKAEADAKKPPAPVDPAAVKRELAEKLRKDPAGAFAELEVPFEEVVMAFAEEKGREPTESEKQELRIAALEAEKKAREEREKQEAEAAQQRDAEQKRDGAYNMIGKIIKDAAEKYPALAEALAEGRSLPGWVADPRPTVIDIASAALLADGKQKAESVEESLAYISAALEVLNEEYEEFGARVARKAAPVTENAVKADAIVELARSKLSGPRTISASLDGGHAPPVNGASKRMTPDQARAEAMELARRLPR